MFDVSYQDFMKVLVSSIKMIHDNPDISQSNKDYYNIWKKYIDPVCDELGASRNTSGSILLGRIMFQFYFGVRDITIYRMDSSLSNLEDMIACIRFGNIKHTPDPNFNTSGSLEKILPEVKKVSDLTEEAYTMLMMSI